MHKLSRASRHLLLATLAFLSLSTALTSPADAQARLSPPPDGFFVSDQAGIIDISDEEEINRIAAKSNNEAFVPIFVLTVNSVRTYAPGSDVETFARATYDTWGIGSPELNGKPWNKGVLLVIAKDDRTSRIQMGGGFGSSLDEQSDAVMSAMTNGFKTGQYSPFIVSAVTSLSFAVTGERPPRSAGSYVVLALIGLGIVLLIGIGISLIRSGKKGWGWACLAAAAAILLYLLYLLSWRGSGGRNGGGSSGRGGGSSRGGGGSTGSW